MMLLLWKNRDNIWERKENGTEERARGKEEKGLAKCMDRCVNRCKGRTQRLGGEEEWRDYVHETPG